MRRPLLLVTLLTAGVASLAGQSTYRAGVDVVSLGVTVLDSKGVPVSGLTAADFEIREDKVLQDVVYFAQLDGPGDVPLHLGLLFDTSASMEQDLAMSRAAAIKFFNTFPQAEDYTLVEFNTEVRVARFAQADFPRLVERIRSRPAKGFTALYDALGVYLDGAAEVSGRKVLVIYTDGGDTTSAQTWPDTRELLRASDVTVHAIGFMEHQSSSLRTTQRRRLEEIAEMTGGRALFPRVMDELDEMYAKVAEEMRAQYTLGYLSTNPANNGQWRRLDIAARPAARPRLTIRSRKGYYAPGRSPDPLADGPGR